MAYSRPRLFLCTLALTLATHTLALADDAASPAAAKDPARCPVPKPTEPFAVLMDKAMARMHTGMTQAPSTGDADADFVAMMIPHHEGAIEMAKAVLLHGRDPALRNLALQIVTEQQNEIKLMEAWRNARRDAGKPSPRDNQ